MKEELSQLPITFFCIHGNHEERPYNISTYEEKQWRGGLVFHEEEYLNLLFVDLHRCFLDSESMWVIK